MLIKGVSTTAREATSESYATSFAARASTTLSCTIWIMLVTRMFAHAFQVLRSKHWNIIEQFADTLFTIFMASTVDFSRINIIEKVFLESVAAEALTRRTNGFAICTLRVSPVNIESIPPSRPYIFLVFFKLLFGHRVSTVILSYDPLIFEVGLDMLSGLTRHNNSLHFIKLSIFEKINI